MPRVYPELRQVDSKQDAGGSSRGKTIEQVAAELVDEYCIQAKELPKLCGSLRARKPRSEKLLMNAAVVLQGRGQDPRAFIRSAVSDYQKRTAGKWPPPHHIFAPKALAVRVAVYSKHAEAYATAKEIVLTPGDKQKMLTWYADIKDQARKEYEVWCKTAALESYQSAYDLSRFQCSRALIKELRGKLDEARDAIRLSLVALVAAQSLARIDRRKKEVALHAETVNMLVERLL